MKQFVTFALMAALVGDLVCADNYRRGLNTESMDLASAYARTMPRLPRFQGHSLSSSEPSRMHQRDLKGYTKLLPRGDACGRSPGRRRGSPFDRGSAGPERGQLQHNRSPSPPPTSSSDARVRVDSHGTGARINVRPNPSVNQGHPSIDAAQKWASGPLAAAATLQRQDDHRVSLDNVGKRVAGNVRVGPHGSAVLQATGAHGTDTKIVGGNMQSSARVTAISAGDDQPAHVSIKATGQGRAAVLGTASDMGPLPDPDLP